MAPMARPTACGRRCPAVVPRGGTLIGGARAVRPAGGRPARERPFRTTRDPLPRTPTMSLAHRTHPLAGAAALLLLWTGAAAPGRADELPRVADVEFQPLSAQVRRIVEALDLLGQPLPEPVKARID